MKILVTAGSTQVMIDKVRAITNIFHGRTGTEIAFDLSWNGHQNEVVLVTSNPLLVKEFEDRYMAGYRYRSGGGASWDPIRHPRALLYKTFAELADIMEEEIRTGGYDVVIHSAAVSDYQVAGVFERGADERLTEADSSAKISSKHQELFLRMVPTFKIVDRIRKEWGFKGNLVKFKLEVGKSDEELIEIARRSRAVSDADLIVANCLEWARERAYIIDRKGKAKSVSRDELPEALAGRLK